MLRFDGGLPSSFCGASGEYVNSSASDCVGEGEGGGGEGEGLNNLGSRVASSPKGFIVLLGSL